MKIHRIKINLSLTILISFSTFCLSFSQFPKAQAWDSQSLLNRRSTHTLLTEWAINEIKSICPEFQQFRKEIIEGANTELHESDISKEVMELGKKYGIDDLNQKRKDHQGTNEGSDDVEGWWKDALSAYKSGKKQQAFFLTGVMLHMIEDMGVPSHANKVYHQGTLREFDNFEYLALFNWKPNFENINREDPDFEEPWKYYYFSRDWTHEDAPSYDSTNDFSKTWLLASDYEKELLSKRQGRTATVAKWALFRACLVFTENSTNPDI